MKIRMAEIVDGFPSAAKCAAGTDCKNGGDIEPRAMHRRIQYHNEDDGFVWTLRYHLVGCIPAKVLDATRAWAKDEGGGKADASGMTMPFTRSKGKAIEDARSDDLRWAINEGPLRDEAAWSTKYAEGNRKLKSAIMQELMRRGE